MMIFYHLVYIILTMNKINMKYQKKEKEKLKINIIYRLLMIIVNHPFCPLQN